MLRRGPKRKLGMPRGGPAKVITDKALLEAEEETGEMTLSARYPGRIGRRCSVVRGSLTSRRRQRPSWPCCGKRSTPRAIPEAEKRRQNGNDGSGRLPRPASQHDDGHGAEHDLEVFEHRLARNVFQVERHLPVDVVDRTIILVVDLCPPRDAGAHSLPLGVMSDLRPEMREDRRLLGARSHHIHVAAHHVD